MKRRREEGLLAVAADIREGTREEVLEKSRTGRWQWCYWYLLPYGSVYC